MNPHILITVDNVFQMMMVETVDGGPRHRASYMWNPGSFEDAHAQALADASSRGLPVCDMTGRPMSALREDLV